MSSKALLIVDVQNDFCPGGRLAVPEGYKVVPVLNKYIKLFFNRGLPIFASRDWHPRKSRHFKKYGGKWPLHCIQRTKGALFHPKLHLPKEAIILSKGMNPKKDSYSAFEATDAKGKSLYKILISLGIKELYIGGLATDYCVKQTTLDALRKGFKVKLLIDAIRGVDPKDSQKAVREMVRLGVVRRSLCLKG